MSYANLYKRLTSPKKNSNTSSNSNSTTNSSGSKGVSLASQGVKAVSNSTANKPTTTNNNTYTPKGTHNDSGLSQWATSQINTYKQQYADAQAKGDEAGMNAAHQAAEAIRAKYGYSGGTDGSDYIKLPDKVFEYTEPQPTYESKYDPQMDALLNEILNREDFSYDVASDPLYQKYAQMYNREGDRVMRDTMAEAAAGAGGMNSYAMTAAMQAGNYYNSQLNDKIPELYQLAYDMYLADKESKVQDLGLLQGMDATQYNRYRDTMADWKDDRNFAYGVYQDDVANKQWQDTFNYNQYVDDRNFNYDSDWRNKEWDYNTSWKDKEWNYNTNQYETESAKEEVWKYISMGITPSAELLAKAGMSDIDVALAVAAVKAEQTKKGTSSSKSKQGNIQENQNENEDLNEQEPQSGDVVAGALSDLGLPAGITAQTLEMLINAGAISEDMNGAFKWNLGWNKNNWLFRVGGLPAL